MTAHDAWDELEHALCHYEPAVDPKFPGASFDPGFWIVDAYNGFRKGLRLYARRSDGALRFTQTDHPHPVEVAMEWLPHRRNLLHDPNHQYTLYHATGTGSVNVVETTRTVQRIGNPRDYLLVIGDFFRDDQGQRRNDCGSGR